MCGFTGLWRQHASECNSFDAATGLMQHRGPDGEGAETWNGIGMMRMGHRRLAILDCSMAGRQPMERDGVRIVYNGEVYNYVELREELAAKGEKFKSGTDTEVLLASWREWGRGCLSRFNGMFAFLMLDLEQEVLFAARDRFGIKPLYYWIGPEGEVAFASEIKQFTALRGWRARVNGERVYDFLAWGLLDHSEETCFEGVRQLPPGGFVELDLKELRNGQIKLAPGGVLPVERWYELKPATVQSGLDAAGEKYGEILTDAVRLRLRADVPVGSCLSGGLDSSSIVLLMNQLLAGQGEQKTFSARSEVDALDEGDWMKRVESAAGVSAHHVKPSGGRLFEELEDLVWHQDEPFGTTSIYAQWCVFRLAAENGVKVMLDGQGADEQLGGYHGFFGVRLAGLFNRLRWIRMLGEMGKVRREHGMSIRSMMQGMASVLLPAGLAQPLRRLAGGSNAHPTWLDWDKLGVQPRDTVRELGDRTASVERCCLAELTATSLPRLLHWEDRNSMAHSVEARVPFLDHRVVEMAMGLPEEHRIADGETKRVLRSAMRGVLPEAVRTRKDKLGFVTAEEYWAKGPQKELFLKHTREAASIAGGIFKPGLMAEVETVLDGRRPFSQLPWRVICFGAWLRRFNVALN